MDEGKVVEKLKLTLYALLFILLSGLFLSFAVWNASSIISYSALDARVEGQVISEDLGRRSCDSNVAYLVGGKTYSTTYGGCPGRSETVKVRYESGDPAHASGDGPLRAYLIYPLVGLVSLILGLFFLGGAIILAGAVAGKKVKRPRIPWVRA